MILRSSALAVVLAAAPAPAQTQVLHLVVGGQPAERLGWSLAGLGDIDSDGRADFAVGVPFDPFGSVQIGTVRVHSGASGALLYTLPGDAALDHCGWSLAAVGDVDLDGAADLLIGLPDSDLVAPDGGAARLVSSASGALLRTIPGSVSGGHLGYAVARAGDVDLDGVPDLLLGAPFDGAGRVELRSGASGALLWAAQGAAAGDRFGFALAGGADVDLDQVPDLAAGADQDGSGAGYVRLYSGATGGLLREHGGAQPGDRFGASLALVPDLDGDGAAELAIGAPRGSAARSHCGTVEVRSGATGALAFFLEGSATGESFGHSLAAAGDLDRDGTADLLVGSLYADALGAAGGSARVVSGRTHGVLRRYAGTAGGDRFGWAVAAAGDVDADGIDDVAVGAPREDLGWIDAGTARVFSGADCRPVVYCTAKPNSQGCTPSIGSLGLPSLSGPDDFHVVAAAVLNNKYGLLFWGGAPNAAPFLGGTLCAALPVVRGPLLASGGNPPPDDCSGLLDQPLTQASFAAQGWTAGTNVYAQFWSRDPLIGDGTSVSLTDALQFQVCP